MLKLLLILFILMLAIGGNRGAKSFIALMLNCFVSFLCFCLLADEYNPYFVLFAGTIFFYIITIFYQNDFNLKTVSSCISILILNIFLCALICFVAGNGHITGLNEIDAYSDSNTYTASAVNINMYAILIMGLIWGQSGAVIDTSISISTALNEIYVNNRTLSLKSLISSGMRIGKDIIGTSVNTLVFVSIGESIMLILLYKGYNYSFLNIINSKSFLSELCAVMISCIGTTLIIPLTAAISAFMFCRESLYKEQKKTQC